MPLSIRLISFFQTLFTFLIAKYVHAHGKVTLTLPFQFKSNETYLFISNHQSQLDAFAVFACFTYRQMRTVAPTRFMTAGGIYYSYLYPFLVLCGCYPTKKKSRPDYDPVAQSIDYLHRGQNVYIFPEGRRTVQSESKPRSGVKRIYDGVRAPITPILIHLEWTVRGKQRDLRVVFKKGATIESPKSLMQEIYRL